MIEVKASPLVDQLISAVRHIAPAVVTYLLAKGIIENDLAVLLSVIGGVLWPILLGQTTVLDRNEKMVAMAKALPDEVAVIK